MKKSLIVISVDFKKSIRFNKKWKKIIEVMKDYKIHPKIIVCNKKWKKIIEVMKDYKIHPKIIDYSRNIAYEGDTTKINIGYDLETELGLDITSGIKQGCTGSTTIFKLA